MPRPSAPIPTCRQRLGAVGLAAGDSIAAWIELGLLWSHLRDQLGSRRIGPGRLRALLPALAVVIVVQVLLQLAADRMGTPLVLEALLVVGTSGLLYVLLCTRTTPAATELVRSVTGFVQRLGR